MVAVFLLYIIIDQSYVQKWLLLTDPEDDAASIKGYLKVNLAVVSPGSTPKSFPSDVKSEDVDIES